MKVIFEMTTLASIGDPVALPLGASYQPSINMMRYGKDNPRKKKKKNKYRIRR